MMKRITLLALCVALPALGQETQKRDYDTSKLSPLGREIAAMSFPQLTWHVPEVGKEISRAVLPNGLVVYMYPDPAVPVAHVQVSIRGGRLYETPEEDQLFGLMVSFLQMGGSRGRTYEEITAELEGMAVSLYGWGESETGTFSAQCLKERLPRVLDVVREVMLEPGFREDKLGLIKRQEAENILRQKDYPSWVIGTLFASRLYGEHPYGRIARLERIDAISREEIQKACARFVVPDRTFIAVSGDVDPEQTLALVKKLFGSWQRSTAPLPPIQRVNEAVVPGFFHFEKDIPQTSIRAGHLSVRRGNPDEFALSVMNSILGGEAFKSRLMSRIRSDEGLAYSAGSWFGTSGAEPTAFGCYAETRNEKAWRSVTIMRETMKEMAEKPPTDEELQQAKETMLNSFIHRWTDTSWALGQIVDLEIEGMPGDYYQKYLDKVRAVTGADVQRVAGKYLHPDRLVVVTVGKRAEMKDWPQEVPLTDVTLPPEYMK